MSDDNKIKTAQQQAPEVPAAPAAPEAAAETPATARTRRCAAAAWIAVVLAVAAWLVLMYGNGYAAIATGVVAIGTSIWGIASNSGALRRLSIAALIASTVLTVVVGAFIGIIKSL